MSLKFIQKSHKTFLRFPDTLTQYFTLEKNGPHCISLLPTVFSLIHEFCVRLLCQKTVRKMGKSEKSENSEYSDKLTKIFEATLQMIARNKSLFKISVLFNCQLKISNRKVVKTRKFPQTCLNCTKLCLPITYFLCSGVIAMFYKMRFFVRLSGNYPKR